MVDDQSDATRRESADDLAALREENARLRQALAESREGIEALVEALEDALEERDGWKWTVESRDRGALGRLRRLIRVAVLGEEADGA